MRTTRRARIIAIAGGKGGVGKTTVAVNLGIVLARSGTSTILVDDDFCLAGIRVLTGTAPRGDLADILSGNEPLESLLSPVAPGLWAIGGLPGKSRDSDAGWHAALEKLSGASDAVIVDGGSGVTEAVLESALAADQIIVPTTPEPTSLADSYAFLKLLGRADYRGSIGVVATMTENDLHAAEVARRIEQVARQFLGLEVRNLGSVPRDAHVSRAVQQRSAVVALYPHCAASRAIQALAGRVVPRQTPGPAVGVLPRIAALFL